MPAKHPTGRTWLFPSDREQSTCLWLLPMDDGESRHATTRSASLMICLEASMLPES